MLKINYININMYFNFYVKFFTFTKKNDKNRYSLKITYRSFYLEM